MTHYFNVELEGDATGGSGVIVLALLQQFVERSAWRIKLIGAEKSTPTAADVLWVLSWTQFGPRNFGIQMGGQFGVAAEAGTPALSYGMGGTDSTVGTGLSAGLEGVPVIIRPNSLTIFLRGANPGAGESLWLKAVIEEHSGVDSEARL